MEPDFSGWATRSGMKCSDGLTIGHGAFDHQDGVTVPLVYQHNHTDVRNVLGHAVLSAVGKGVRADAFLNKSEAATAARELIVHGDVSSLSIWANKLKMKAGVVAHGMIQEVSLVLSGANPGAHIDIINIRHGDGSLTETNEAIITTGREIKHSFTEEDLYHDGDEDDKTVQDVIDSMTEEQLNVLYFMVGAAADGDDSAEHSDLNGGLKGNNMRNNVFDKAGGKTDGPHLSHDQLSTILKDAQSCGSYKEAFLAHAVDYGIENIDFLFPDAQKVRNAPDLVKRRTEWVSTWLNGVSHTPFSRIKSMSADITHEEARAKGYVKGTEKKEEFFAIAKRTTSPKTIYKKQKLDRDDIIDITDLDVVAWLKAEMHLMLEEEVARAQLLGDGREVDDDDKIDEDKIRPVATDDNFYTHRVDVAPNTSGQQLIDEVLRHRKHYKGVGNPTMFTTEDVIVDLLLLRDKIGRRLYRTLGELADELRVSSIVPVEVMEGHTDEDGNYLLAVLLNVSDYNVGGDPGGKTSFFDDFDIDFNQYKYLYETRLSGALTKPKSAMAFWRAAGIAAAPTAPSFNGGTNTITIPSVTGVVYLIDDVVVTGSVVIGEDTTVQANPDEGYFFAPGTVRSWDFIYVP